MPKQGYVSFKIAAVDHEVLKALAAAKGYSLSEMVRLCLRAGLRLAPDFPAKPTAHAISTGRAAQAA